MTKKIALFLPTLNGGGAERVLVTLANSLVNIGYSVDFVLSNATGTYLSTLDEKIKIFDLGQKQVLISLFGLAHYLRTQQPAVIISGLSNANAAAILASNLFFRSCNVIITQHNNWSQVLLNDPTRKERILYQLSKYLYPFATRIVAVSTGIADEISRMKNVDPKKVLCIYNSVVTPHMLELSRQPPTHPWLTRDSEPVLLGVGRLIKLKDFETLIRAFSKVQSQMACKLLILGEGPERQNLENLVRELGLTGKVELPGFSPNPYSFMAHADLFVLSSRSEGLPTALIEALACGTPVVATDCVSGPAEILDGGKYGSLVQVGNIEDLSQAIIDCLQNPPSKDLLKKRAQLYSVENATRAYANLIDQVITSK